MPSQVFSPEIFNRYETFQSFMSGKDEINAIRAQISSRVNVPILVKKIGIIVLAPLNAIGCIFFYISSYCLNFVHATNLALRCKVLSSYFLVNVSLATFLFSYLGKDLLVFAKNMQDPSTSDFYLTKKIERKSIADEQLKKLLYLNLVDKWGKENFTDVHPNDPDDYKKILDSFNKYFHEINFEKKYVCAGISSWFAYLYYKTVDSKNPLKQIAAVAKQFENGAPRQASLLQSLFSSMHFNDQLLNVLDLHGEKVVERMLNIASKEGAEEDCHNLERFLSKTEEGVYLINFIGVNSHSICFINQGAHKFIFDPNIGLIQIDNEKTFKSYYNSQIKKCQMQALYQDLVISKVLKGPMPVQAAKKDIKVIEPSKGILSTIAHVFWRTKAAA